MAFDEYGGLDPEAESFDSFAQYILRNAASEPCLLRMFRVTQFARWSKTATSAIIYLRFSVQIGVFRSRYMNSGSKKAPDFYTGAQTPTSCLTAQQ